MATRRKYRDGGRVPVIDNGAKFDKVDTVIVDAPVEAAPVSSPAAPPPSTVDDDNPLLRAHAASMRAEALQRQAATAPSAQRPQTIDDVIASLPGLTEHKRAFLKANPHFLEPANAKEVAFHYRASLAAGIPDDTAAMNEAILAGLKREREHAVEQARAVVEAPAAPRRPSVRVSAPVSREAPAMSGRRQPNDWNTLSPEEVDMAHRSFVDRPDMPRLSNIDKERLYLEQRNKYRRMKAEGSYSEQRE